jgi:hypothetical protein
MHGIGVLPSAQRPRMYSPVSNVLTCLPMCAHAYGGCFTGRNGLLSWCLLGVPYNVDC